VPGGRTRTWGLVAAVLAVALTTGAATAEGDDAGQPGISAWHAAPPRWAGDGSAAPMAYSTLLHAAHRERVRRAVVDSSSNRVLVQLADGSRRTVVYPPAEPVAGLLTRAGADVQVAQVPTLSGGSSRQVVTILVLVVVGLVAGAVVVTRMGRRRSQSEGASAGHPAAGVPSRSVSVVRFSDVAGCDEAIVELADTIEFLRNPGRFRRLGARMPPGIILHGPPGTGKTLLAKAVAGEAGVPFIAASATDFVEMYVGVGAKRIRELFARARRSETGGVIFIDELDAVGRRRASGPSSNTEVENTLNALLVELDGFEARGRVVCIGATNRIDLLDDALIRPGRFGLQVHVAPPAEAGRRAILELYAKDAPLADDVDLAGLAAVTAGSTGAQLAELINQAAIVAARRDADAVTAADLVEGHLRVLAGPERAAAPVREDERRLIAWHEAGHVLAAELLETQDKAERVSVVPRGRAAGLALYQQVDRALFSRRYVHERIMCVLAGRAAEQLLVGELSSGAANDLQQANLLARKAVQELGFSARLAHVTSDGNGGVDAHVADATRRIVDEEVGRMVADAQCEVHDLLAGDRPRLDALAEALLERGTLERGTLERVDIAGVLQDVERRPPAVVPPPPLAPKRPAAEAGEQRRPLRPAGAGRLVAAAHRLEARPWITILRRRPEPASAREEQDPAAVTQSG
jgi:cell division protease FtsH